VIVVDASAVIEWLLGLPRAEPVAARLESEPSAHAPHLLDLEVAQVLRRLEATGRIEADRGRQAIDDLADLDLGRHPHDVLLPRVWQLRQNLTAYDAVYVALAEALDAPLLTLDRRLARATSVHAIVQVVE
jgi:predicted nucleic acid-binding protein